MVWEKYKNKSGKWRTDIFIPTSINFEWIVARNRDKWAGLKIQNINGDRDDEPYYYYSTRYFIIYFKKYSMAGACAFWCVKLLSILIQNVIRVKIECIIHMYSNCAKVSQVPQGPLCYCSTIEKQTFFLFLENQKIKTGQQNTVTFQLLYV